MNNQQRKGGQAWHGVLGYTQRIHIYKHTYKYTFTFTHTHTHTHIHIHIHIHITNYILHITDCTFAQDLAPDIDTMQIESGDGTESAGSGDHGACGCAACGRSCSCDPDDEVETGALKQSASGMLSALQRVGVTISLPSRAAAHVCMWYLVGKGYFGGRVPALP